MPVRVAMDCASPQAFDASGGDLASLQPQSVAPRGSAPPIEGPKAPAMASQKVMDTISKSNSVLAAAGRNKGAITKAKGFDNSAMRGWEKHEELEVDRQISLGFVSAPLCPYVGSDPQWVACPVISSPPNLLSFVLWDVLAATAGIPCLRRCFHARASPLSFLSPRELPCQPACAYCLPLRVEPIEPLSPLSANAGGNAQSYHRVGPTRLHALCRSPPLPLPASRSLSPALFHSFQRAMQNQEA